MDTDSHTILDMQKNKINENKEIIIGDHVWIGCRSIILKGTKIPDNSIIGAGSLVTKELQNENTIFTGNPIKAIKSDISWQG